MLSTCLRYRYTCSLLMIAALIDLQGLVVASAQQPMDGQMTFAMPAQPQPYLGYDYQPQMGWPQTPGIAPGGASADYSVFRQEGNAADRQVIQSSYFQDDQAPAMSDVATGQGSAAGTGTTVGGYIDAAQIRSRLRFRFDAAYDNPFPDRAEFFYAKCGCFSGGNGPGPPLPETSVDYQESEMDIEFALSRYLSSFVELGVRSINPEVNANHTGLSDVRAGFKYALIADPDRWLTFQLRGYFPTGDGDAGLGTEHFSLEPGLLFQRNDDWLSFFGEFKAWIPFSSEQAPFPGSTDPLKDFAGPVLRYGLGAGYDLYRDCTRSQPNPDRLTLVTEFVGWTVLDGLKFATTNPNQPPDPKFFIYESAAGDTIINLKLGLRWSTLRNSIYVGYGRALTGDVWYKDIVRAEYEMRF